MEKTMTFTPHQELMLALKSNEITEHWEIINTAMDMGWSDQASSIPTDKRLLSIESDYGVQTISVIDGHVSLIHDSEKIENTLPLGDTYAITYTESLNTDGIKRISIFSQESDVYPVSVTTYGEMIGDLNKTLGYLVR